jgi:GNAT superfamily N-acetyltransferase
MRRLDGGYELDDERTRLDRDAIVAFLTGHAYWQRWRSRVDIDRQIDNSFRCLGIYAPDGAQVAFGRVVSDGVALGYLSDVYVLAEHRGHGLGTTLVEELIATGPDWRWLLNTRDAHDLYRKVGFDSPTETVMERPARR